MTAKVLLLVVAAEILTAAGQIMFKKSANSVEFHSLRGAESVKRFLGSVMSRPTIRTGLLSMAAGMMVWIAALAQADLSLVFSLGSIQYIMILFLAHYLLGEKIDRMKLIGTILVAAGIILITIS